MSMGHLCDIIDNPDYQNFQFLLSLNDSMLIQIISEYEIYDDAQTFRQTIRSKIPGKLLIQCQIFHVIWNIFPPILFLLGTIGNTIAFAVLVQRKLIRMTTYYYLAVLTCFDQIILIIGLLRRWIERVGIFSSADRWTIWCQVFQFIGVSTSFMSTWLIVAVTMERLIVIKLPLRVNSFVSIRKTKVIIICLFIIAVTISSHFFQTVGLVNRYNRAITSSKFVTSSHNNTFYCDFKNDYVRFAKFWTFVDAILYSCLPLILMTGMNLYIGYGIYRADLNRGELVHVNNHFRANNTIVLKKCNNRHNRFCSFASRYSSPALPNRETRQLTIMLMVVSCTFLITTSPLVMLKFYYKLTGYNNNNVLHSTKIELMDTVFEMLMYTNHAINFLLYCASGKKFRYQVKRFFEKYSCKKSVETIAIRYNRNTTLGLIQTTI